jgi:hypothetical protein
MSEKILIVNRTALQKKYGPGLTALETALNKLVAADQGRGLQTRVVALDDARQMQAVNAVPVQNAKNPRQNKAAIDAIYRKTMPDYLVIVGSTDVIPHQDLRNPLYTPNDPNGDPDEFAFGDIPYACEASYSKEAKDFIGPTRVLGRLPDITGSSDPKYLVGLLDVAANWKQQNASQYLSYLGMSAEVWQQSTAESLRKTFGSDKDLQVCPPKGPRWTAAQLARPSHFINCHGAASSPVFFGQPKGKEQFPDAHLAEWIDGRIRPGTVVAAECCYGAELYDPQPVENHQVGICNTYLGNAAYGFFGSTTIAYGPPSGNGSADLIAQFFLQRMLAGSSLGRAALEARQSFAHTAAPLGPEDLKTIAQFILLGDPSIQPVPTPKPHDAVKLVRNMRKIVSPTAMLTEDRAAIRRRLFTRGISLAETQSFAVPRPKAAASSLAKTLMSLARKAGISAPKLLSFDIEAPVAMARKSAFMLAERISAPSAFHVAIGRVGREAPVTRLVLVVAKEERGQIVSVRELQSR